MLREQRVIGVGVIGTGTIAERHVRALTQINHVKLHWSIGERLSNARQFAERWNISCFSDALISALHDSKVDVVVVASPNQFHVEHTLLSLESSKHVIVEIPVVLQLCEAHQVQECAIAKQRRVFACHTLRANSAVREVRNRVQRNQLRLSQISGHFAIPRRNNEGLHGQRAWVDNLLWHHGCHQIDAALWILNNPPCQSITAVAGKTHPKYGMLVDVAVHFATSDQQIVTQSLTYNCAKPLWELRFVGDEEVLMIRNGKLFTEAGDELETQSFENDLAVQDQEIIDAVRNNHPTVFDLDAVLPSLEVLQQAQSFIDVNTEVSTSH